MDVSRAWLDLESATRGRFLPAVATVLGRIGEFDLAEEVFQAILRAHPDRLDVNVERMRFLLETKRVDEGLALARGIVERWPDAEPAHHVLRTYRFLDGMRREAEVIGHARRAGDGSGWVVVNEGAARSLGDALESRHPDWIVIADGDAVEGVGAHLVNAAAVGCVALPSGGRAWRVEALRDLQDSGLLDVATLPEDLDRAAPFYLRPRPSSGGCGTALVISRYGPHKFGGGEHFIRSAAHHYLRSGLDRALIVGDEAKRPRDFVLPNSGEIEFDFLPLRPEEIRKRIIAEDVRLIHAISGTGFAVSAACAFMNVPFVYGVHFFREVFGRDGEEKYFDENGDIIPREEFAYLLARASTVYANSSYTQDLIERAHRVRCPVIFSVPEGLKS